LPIIVPIVFYNGEQTPYPQPVELLTLFDDPFNIMKNIVQSRFHLIDVGQIPDEKLREKTWSNVLQFCMKHAFDRDFYDKTSQMIVFWQWLEIEGAEDTYLVTTHSLNFRWTKTFSFARNFEEKSEKKAVHTSVCERHFKFRNWILGMIE
jgi:hypothetical protein